MLLSQRRGDDINFGPVLVDSRHDVTGNAGVDVAAGAVGVRGSPWPDIIIGLRHWGVSARRERSSVSLALAPLSS